MSSFSCSKLWFLHTVGGTAKALRISVFIAKCEMNMEMYTPRSPNHSSAMSARCISAISLTFQHHYIHDGCYRHGNQNKVPSYLSNHIVLLPSISPFFSASFIKMNLLTLDSQANLGKKKSNYQPKKKQTQKHI